MNSTSYADWISLYDNEFNSIWLKEQKELRKVSMMYFAIQKEFSKIRTELAGEITNIHLELKKKNENNPNNKENVDNSSTDLDSPKSPTSPEYPAATNPVSPAIKSKRIRKQQIKSVSKSGGSESSKCQRKLLGIERIQTNPLIVVAQSPDILECSIIESTPKPIRSLKKSKLNKNSLLFPQKPCNKTNSSNSGRQATLTQILGEPKSKLQKTEELSDADITCIGSDPDSLEIDDMLELINKQSQYNSDETNISLDVKGGKVNLANKSEEVEKKKKSYNISLSFVQNYDKVPERKKTNEPNFVYEPEVVRGKERKKLPGWSCRECEQFYKCMDLSPEELKKKMNECSKHRRKFQPREETYDGFWDLSFKPTPPTQEDSEKSLIFQFKK